MESSKLPITGPCPIDLDAIGFDRAARKAHCTHCDKNVHNLSNMTEAEARTFLREVAGEKLCVSYARDAEGKIRFKQPEPAVVPLARLRPRRAAAAMAVPGLGLAAALAACTPVDNPNVDKPRIERTQPRHVEHEAGGMEVPEDIEPVEVVAGNMPIPEDIEQGKMEVPEDIVDGEIEAPPVEMVEGEIEALPIEEPCDQKPEETKTEAQPAEPPAGKMDALGEAK